MWDPPPTLVGTLIPVMNKRSCIIAIIKKKIPFEARLSSGSEVKRAAGGDVNVSQAASGKKPLRVTLRESR